MQQSLFSHAFIQIMIFKAVTVLLAVLCSSLALLIPQLLPPSLFSFNFFSVQLSLTSCSGMSESSKFVDIIPTSDGERYPGLETSTEMNLLGVFGCAST
ncbi:hypothetical protein P692DRAFT_20842249 [Suillus brevipes Sb2]|nr:hypothetical protein P692DRAFT_20842249 [Suillus brevipes Sb2]